jgi:hypothetical protein
MPNRGGSGELGFCFGGDVIVVFCGEDGLVCGDLGGTPTVDDGCDVADGYTR